MNRCYVGPILRPWLAIILVGMSRSTKPAFMSSRNALQVMCAYLMSCMRQWSHKAVLCRISQDEKVFNNLTFSSLDSSLWKAGTLESFPFAASQLTFHKDNQSSYTESPCEFRVMLHHGKDVNVLVIYNMLSEFGHCHTRLTDPIFHHWKLNDG